MLSSLSFNFSKNSLYGALRYVCAVCCVCVVRTVAYVFGTLFQMIAKMYKRDRPIVYVVLAPYSMRIVCAFDIYIIVRYDWLNKCLGGLANVYDRSYEL